MNNFQLGGLDQDDCELLLDALLSLEQSKSPDMVIRMMEMMRGVSGSSPEDVEERAEAMRKRMEREYTTEMKRRAEAISLLRAKVVLLKQRLDSDDAQKAFDDARED